IDENILSAIVVEVAPHTSHRDAFARLVEIGESGSRADIFERAVTIVTIESVGLAELAVGEVEIGSSVTIEIGDGYRGAQRRHVRLNVGNLRIEGRPVVNEVDPGG